MKVIRKSWIGDLEKASLVGGEYFVFSERNGLPKVSSYDVGTFVQVGLSCTSGCLKGVYSSKVLLGLLKRLEDEEIVVEERGGDLYMSGDSWSASVSGTSVDWADSLGVLEACGDEWFPIPEGFFSAIEMVKRCPSFRGIPVGRLVNIEDGKLEFVDGFQAVRFLIDGLKVNGSVVLLLSSLEKVLELKDLIKGYCVNDEWLMFSGDDLLIKCVRDRFEYPKIDHVFSLEGGVNLFLPSGDGAKEALERACVFLKSDSTLRVSFLRRSGGEYDGEMRIEGGGSVGRFSQWFPSSFPGRDVVFFVLPKLLLSCVSLKGDKCTFVEREGSGGRLCVSGERWSYVVAVCTGEEDKGVGGEGEDLEEGGEEEDEEEAWEKWGVGGGEDEDVVEEEIEGEEEEEE